MYTKKIQWPIVKIALLVKLTLSRSIRLTSFDIMRCYPVYFHRKRDFQMFAVKNVSFPFKENWFFVKETININFIDEILLIISLTLFIQLCFFPL